jgi:hypothetical protein
MKCLALIAFVLGLGGSSFACSAVGCVGDGEELLPTFTIKVKLDDKPLAGATFHIKTKGVEQFSGVTDNAGGLLVSHLPPGFYWIQGDMLSTGITYGCFHVSDKASRKAKARLTYTWADEALRTSKMAGQLVASLPARSGTPIWNLTHRVDQPIAGAAITVHDAVSRAVYKTVSDQDGRFLIEGLPNGTYVVHIEGGSAADFTYDPEDDVIRLDISAKRNELLFKGGPSGCGGNQLSLDLFHSSG